MSKYYLGILFFTLSFLCFTCRLRGAKNTVVRDYVLPDYTHIKRGYVKVGRVLICYIYCTMSTIEPGIQFNCIKQVNLGDKGFQCINWSLVKMF